MNIRTAILTVSDRAANGVYLDDTGPTIESVLTAMNSGQSFEISARMIVPDNTDIICETLRTWCDSNIADFIVTNGGTGLSPNDLTPEATRQVIDREVPGLGEVMRDAGRSSSPFAALSRQTAGIRNSTLIVNVPGAPSAASECLLAVLDVIPHALATITNQVDVHAH